MVTKIESLLVDSVEEVIGKESLLKKLQSNQKLVIKLGVDPTSPDLHLGHAVVLRKLRQFQDLGHQAVLVIGDFTALIGDPSGKSVTRPVLTEKEVKSNLKTYVDQAKLILDMKKAKIVYNSAWLGKLNFASLLKITSLISVNTLLERDDFSERLKSNQSLGLHELLYPISQAIDSVELQSSVELGGWDQRLNLLLARELQKKMGQPSQDLIILKVLVGLDGIKKMSKSLNNYIGISESADSMFGKIMSLPDNLTIQYGELAASMGSAKEVEQQLKGLHPKDQKIAVAKKVVEIYHGTKQADLAAVNFDQTFRDKKIANQLSADLLFSQDKVRLLDAVVEAAKVSRSQAERLIMAGAVRLAGKTMTDNRMEIELSDSGQQLQVGKHTFRNLLRRR